MRSEPGQGCGVPLQERGLNASALAGVMNFKSCWDLVGVSISRYFHLDFPGKERPMIRNPLSFASGSCLLLGGMFLLALHGSLVGTSVAFGAGMIVGMTLATGAAILIIRIVIDRQQEKK